MIEYTSHDWTHKGLKSVIFLKTKRDHDNDDEQGF